MGLFNDEFQTNLKNNKARERGTPYRGNATLTQFYRTMQREGKTVTTYTSGTEFQAFFRIKNDNESEKNTIIIYYDVATPVRPGTLIKYRCDVFVTLNRESVENDVYYKSTLIKCNGVFNNIDGLFGNIPFYSKSMKSSLSIGNNILTTLNGNIELITEDNELSDKITINGYFNEFGRTFRVSNKYVMDGILHVIAEIEADRSPTKSYDIVIEGIPEKNVQVGDEITLSVRPNVINDNLSTDLKFEWISSDINIATVDENGNVIFKSNGNVEIIVTWLDKNLSKSTGNILVGHVEEWDIKILGNSHMKNGYSKTYRILSEFNGEESYLEDVEYEIIDRPEKLEFTEEIFDPIKNNLTLCVDNEDMIGETFKIRAFHKEKKLSTTFEVTIVSIMYH